MRILILSGEIYHEQLYGKVHYEAPYNVAMDVSDLNTTDGFDYSVFDYDVTIVIITEDQYNSIGYYYNLPKFSRDVQIALENGRSVICLPKSSNFHSHSTKNFGMHAYEWLKDFGIQLQDNVGKAIKATGAGRTQVIRDYLKYAPKYYQILVGLHVPPQSRLAVVDDTEIVVGLEYQIKNGLLVILPPPTLNTDTYLLEMSSLYKVAQRYYEKSQRKILLSDAPDWLGQFIVPRAKELEKQIHILADEKTELDQIGYILYGTGDELENSVVILLQKLGLNVKLEPPGANIDLKAKHPILDLGFAIEVTGTKGTIQKDSNKISQAWQYLSERVGTSEEQDRLIILANTQCNLNPKQRRDDAFSSNVVKLLADKGVLLMTTSQLYEIWKEVYEEKMPPEDVIRDLHSKSGLYKP